MNNFILQCQQGGETVRNMAELQRGLLNAEIQQQVQSRVESLETKMKNFLQKQNEDNARKDSVLALRLKNFEDMLVRQNDFMDGHEVWWERQKEGLLSSLIGSLNSSPVLQQWIKTTADQAYGGVQTSTDTKWQRAEAQINGVAEDL